MRKGPCARTNPGNHHRRTPHHSRFKRTPLVRNQWFSFYALSFKTLNHYETIDFLKNKLYIHTSHLADSLPGTKWETAMFTAKDIKDMKILGMTLEGAFLVATPKECNGECHVVKIYLLYLDDGRIVNADQVCVLAGEPCDRGTCTHGLLERAKLSPTEINLSDLVG